MNFIFSLFFMFPCFASILSTDWHDDYIQLIRNHNFSVTENNTENLNEIEAKSFARNKFTCNTFISTRPRPSSVHSLRPNDIDVISAIGDSLTAANGAKAFTVIGLLEEARGVSWSMGGEKPDVNELITLPNILRQFNPNLYGFSIGSGKAYSTNAVFNLANPGDTSFQMLQQAKDLVNRMRRSNKVDFLRSWKLVTFFVGGNDLCKSCKNSLYSAQNYIANVRDTLDYFKNNLPRTLVNMVLSLDVTGIDALTGITCRNMQKTFCDCGLSQEYRKTLLGLTKSIQNGIEDLVNSGFYDTSDQFTVVIQPFMKLMKPPTKSDGSADYSYFAPDCFHFSLKGHQAAAVELWKSMITPVGKKQVKWTNLNQNIACPNQNVPFIFTNKNSWMAN